VTVDVLYGYFEGGQRLISRFLVQPRSDTGTWNVTVSPSLRPGPPRSPGKDGLPGEDGLPGNDGALGSR
jgi:hypothetical protein